MDPATIQLIIFALSELVKAYPQIRADIQGVLNKETPTAEDWIALRSRIAAEDYFKFVPASALPHPAAPTPVTQG